MKVVKTFAFCVVTFAFVSSAHAAPLADEVESLAVSIQTFAASVSVADAAQKDAIYAAQFSGMLDSANALYDKALNGHSEKVQGRVEECLEALSILASRR